MFALTIKFWFQIRISCALCCTDLQKRAGNSLGNSCWAVETNFLLLLQGKRVLRCHPRTACGSYAAPDKAVKVFLKSLTSPFCLFHGILGESISEGSPSPSRKENGNTFFWTAESLWRSEPKADAIPPLSPEDLFGNHRHTSYFNSFGEGLLIPQT